MPDYQTHKNSDDRKTRKYERRKAWVHNKSQHSKSAKKERRLSRKQTDGQ